MKNYLLLLLAAFITCKAFSQSDTTLLYFNKQGKETIKDSGVLLMKYVKQGNLWYGIAFDSKTGIIGSEGTYAEKNLKTPVGHFKNYDEKGILENTADYTSEGKRLKAIWFYKSGNKKSEILYTESGIRGTAWDEKGKEIKDYIFEREAKFKGGLEAWTKFLEKNLNAQVAADAGAPPGEYKVTVQFVINKEGYISNIEPVTVPEKCKPCYAEVKRLLISAPRWEPAVQNNVAVLYQAIQNVVFQVAEETRRKRRN